MSYAPNEWRRRESNPLPSPRSPAKSSISFSNKRGELVVVLVWG